MAKTLGRIKAMRARQKQKLRAKAGRPCEALRVRSANFFEYIFDDILITQTVKLMELIKMMVKMMKMMEISRQLNKKNNLNPGQGGPGGFHGGGCSGGSPPRRPRPELNNANNT